jgi:adenylylsulfate kinase-like enzyme
MMPVKVLALSGSMGAGKSTILGEASELLRGADVHHAALDLDHFSQGHYRETSADELMLRNLSSVWNNYAAAGATHLLVAKPFDTVMKRQQLAAVIPGADIVVCRLTAPLPTMQERVRRREQGSNQAFFIQHVATLERLLDANQIEDFTVDNDGRPATDVAHEVLTVATWL